MIGGTWRGPGPMVRGPGGKRFPVIAAKPWRFTDGVTVWEVAVRRRSAGARFAPSLRSGCDFALAKAVPALKGRLRGGWVGV